MEFDGLTPSLAAGVATRDPSQWCGKHAPAKPGYCTRHDGVPLHELHDEAIAEAHGVTAIFYCPKLGCDKFDWDTRMSAAPGAGFCHRQELSFDKLANLIFGFEIFRNAVRLKIFFLKQRQLMEKLTRAGFFEGGKKT
ncbi:MAG: hypothetical protein HYW91_02930 [Candidatus Sungbacteria bacterium]|nr:hypothetical protein [Candidatus Sungbacteria bacterium]